MLQGDMNKGGETMTYGRNHMIAGFKPSCGKWTYIVMQRNLNYGEWVWYGVSGFQLVHSMLLGEHDNPKIRALAHDGFVKMLVIWGLCNLALRREKTWRRPSGRKVSFVLGSYVCTLFWCKVRNVSILLNHIVFDFGCR